MKNRSKLMIVAAVAASCVLLAGCGSSASSTASSAASSESAPGSVVLSQVESALPDDGTNSPDELADEVNTLRKDKNAAFEFCDAEYYMAYKDGRLVGRVAAIINNRANERWNRKSVRFGWIDFIDDREVSADLLKAVEDFGRSHGMTEVVGPLGFTDMDPEGMLTEGFDQLGTMATIYNYPYYPEHIEAQEGWIVDNKYVSTRFLCPTPCPSATPNWRR